MKLKIYNTKKVSVGTVELPSQFSEPLRKDLIKRAVLTIQANSRQPYGSMPGAGERHSAMLSKRRRSYRGTYGIGQSRTPRKVMSRNGTQFHYVGAVAPQTVGGRRAHPPKSEKDWTQKINVQERRKAIRSAIAATIDKNLVLMRGHLIPDDYPFIIDSSFENLKTTKELREVLEKLGFTAELDRTQKKTIRAGKGTMRGRKYQKKKSLLIITSKDSPLLKAASNITGVEIVNVTQLNAEQLAPGSSAGRATLWTDGAIDRLSKEQLFQKNVKLEQPAKKEVVKPKPSKLPAVKKIVKKATKKTVKKIVKKK
ncbi:50S ribosomal protein L4 [Candidatus Woesearchaeota archaeon]|nr:50S ribosomal protein L4 [Candidatus Woesearchaeota archaeon]